MFLPYRYNENQWRLLNGVYRQHQSAQNFLSNYDNQAVAMILFNIHSGSLWTITPPDLMKLREEVASCKCPNLSIFHYVSHLCIITFFAFFSLAMRFNVTIDWRVERRQSSPEDKGYSEGTHTIHLPALVDGKRNPVRQDLQTVMLASKICAHAHHFSHHFFISISLFYCFFRFLKQH